MARSTSTANASGMLVVTHEMNFARDVAHRVAFMDEGRIVEMGEAAPFFASPASERSRAFLRRVSPQ